MAGADNLGTLNNDSNTNGQQGSQTKFSFDPSSFTSPEQLAYLKSIDETLKRMLMDDSGLSRNGKTSFSGVSQSDLRNGMHSKSDYLNVSRRSSRGSSKGFTDSFEDTMRDYLFDSILGSDFKKRMETMVGDFADLMGVNIKDIPSTLGKTLGKQVIARANASPIVQNVLGNIRSSLGAGVNRLKDAFNAGVGRYDQHNGSTFGDKISQILDGKYERTNTKSASQAAAEAKEGLAKAGYAVRPSQLQNLSIDNVQTLTIHAQSVVVQDAKSEQSDEVKELKEALESNQTNALAVIEDSNSEVKNALAIRDNNMLPATVESKDEQVPIDMSQFEFYDSISSFKDSLTGALGDAKSQLKQLFSGRGGSGLGGRLGNLSSRFSNSKFGQYAAKGQQWVNDAKERGKEWLQDKATEKGKQVLKDKLGDKAKSELAKKAASGTGKQLATKAGTSLVAKGGGALVASGSGAAAGTAAAGTAAAGAGAGTAAGATLAGAASATGVGAVVVVAVVALIFTIKKLVNAFGPAIEGMKSLVDGLKKSANRDKESRKQNNELAKKRMKEDYDTVVRTPFKILEDAAQKVYDAWDASLRKINQTQGYNKSDLQNLMSDYSQRLRDEGLTKIIGATDITDSLSHVLDSGLSGAVAEEFAYIATKLNAAVPTQDFFGYADQYAAIAATAIQNGASQSEAIAYANAQLETFASNILYASRQLTGGFSTGLKDAQSLFTQSVQIAQAAKTNNAANIGGILTSISAIVGSVAPDLSSGIVEAVTKAATGGNSDQIVALRSLAGINASNTEFLKSIANDPQSVFADLFDNLGKMQKMSEGNYMEVAEGLSEVFGVSMDAFARVDFNYLASAIRSMNLNNASLDENMKLLASGESTSNAEMQRIAQINEYMATEGLAYVLDNEAAREIQKHMWDEQLAREIMESEYSVNLKGAAMDALTGIVETVNSLLNFFNPFAWFKKVVNVVNTAAEGAAQEADLQQLLQLGKVGNGDALSLYRLTTRNQDLNVADSLVSQFGGISAYSLASSVTKLSTAITNPFAFGQSMKGQAEGYLTALGTKLLTSSFSNISKNSKYSWGTVSKSAAAVGSGKSVTASNLASSAGSAASSAAASADAAASRVQAFIDSAGEFAASGKTYDEWVKTAGQYQIKDLASDLESAGLTEDTIRQQFQNESTKAAADREAERKKREERFWDNLESYTQYIRDKQDPILDTLTSIDSYVASIDAHSARIDSTDWAMYQKYDTNWNAWAPKFDENWSAWLSDRWDTWAGDATWANWSNKDWDNFLKSWIEYYTSQVAYEGIFGSSDVFRIRTEEGESKDTAIYNLANALTSALSGDNAKNPTLQTNALLSQILLLLNAIAQQQNSGSTSTPMNLADTFAGLALGFFNTGG